jgi:zinc transport system substrate-binding protein
MKQELRIVCLTLSLLVAAPAQAAPQVLASIAPIHSLAAAVMEGVGEPVLLVPATASDHDYALRPSDVRKIAAADLVVWIGEPLEGYLVKALETEGVASLELIEAAGAEPHPFTGVDEEPAADEPGGDHVHGNADEQPGHSDEHDHLGLDPHIWLDPVRAQALVEAIAERLALMDAENAEQYRQNAADTVRDLQALDTEIRSRLAPVAGKPFITFHDGYSYFVERYGLNQVGRLTVDPDRSAGAATVAALRRLITDENVSCAFAEPQFDPGTLQALAGEARVKIGVLDAVGADFPPGPALYSSLLRRNAEAVGSCLLPNS